MRVSIVRVRSYPASTFDGGICPISPVLVLITGDCCDRSYFATGTPLRAIVRGISVNTAYTTRIHKSIMSILKIYEPEKGAVIQGTRRL